jgi:YjbE family integral membrane protein
MMQPAFWIAVGQIIWINILLSGDNAVVIALACRSLPPRQRFWGILLGAGAAVLLRIFFTVIIAQIMGVMFLKLVGGLLLLWIAIKLIVPSEEHGEGSVQAGDTLWRAVWLVTVADIVMSLDNVIAIAAAAETAAMRVDVAHALVIKTTLIIFGLATSVPLIIAGGRVHRAGIRRQGAPMGRRRRRSVRRGGRMDDPPRQAQGSTRAPADHRSAGAGGIPAPGRGPLEPARDLASARC